MEQLSLDWVGSLQAARKQFDGVSMRILKQYMVGTDFEVTRLDVLWGALWLRPEWCVCIPDAI